MHARNGLPIRAVLFDKDGTLVDFDRTWGPAVQAVLRHLAGGNAALYHKLSADLPIRRFLGRSTDFCAKRPQATSPPSVILRPL